MRSDALTLHVAATSLTSRARSRFESRDLDYHGVYSPVADFLKPSNVTAVPCTVQGSSH